MEKKTKIALKYPVFSDGVEIKALNIRRPKVRDMLGVETGTKIDAQKEIDLFANLCEITPEVLMDLDMADYSKLQKAYQDFLS